MLPGVPSIYYGQELGLTGTVGDWGSDANHIPVREAFPWTSSPNDAGNASFYRDTGEWWDQSIYNTPEIEQLALAHQQSNPSSLWNLYKSLLTLRTENEVLRTGSYSPVDLSSDFIGFKRANYDSYISIVVNLSAESVTLNAEEFGLGNQKLLGDANLNDMVIEFRPYSFIILKE